MNKVRVYWNLTRQLWSVMAMPKRRIACRQKHMVLEDLSFLVSEAGRQRVLRDKVKNVHAFACGLLTSESILGKEGGPVVPVTYNPYKGPTFVSCDEHRPVIGGRRALLTYEMVGLKRFPRVFVQEPIYGS